MAKPIITPEAEEDIKEILAYIARDNFEASIDLYVHMTDVFEMLGENPFAGRVRDELKEQMRSFPFGSYLIFYRIWAGRIAIARVLHSARDMGELFS
jgi:toxin ParE1/3/4